MQKAFSRHWYLRANLSAFFRTRTLGRTAPKTYWQSLTTSMLFVLKSFINSLLNVKSNEWSISNSSVTFCRATIDLCVFSFLFSFLSFLSSWMVNKDLYVTCWASESRQILQAEMPSIDSHIPHAWLSFIVRRKQVFLVVYTELDEIWQRSIAALNTFVKESSNASLNFMYIFYPQFKFLYCQLHDSYGEIKVFFRNYQLHT